MQLDASWLQHARAHVARVWPPPPSENVGAFWNATSLSQRASTSNTSNISSATSMPCAVGDAVVGAAVGTAEGAVLAAVARCKIARKPLVVAAIAPTAVDCGTSSVFGVAMPSSVHHLFSDEAIVEEQVNNNGIPDGDGHAQRNNNVIGRHYERVCSIHVLSSHAIEKVPNVSAIECHCCVHVGTGGKYRLHVHTRKTIGGGARDGSCTKRFDSGRVGNIRHGGASTAHHGSLRAHRRMSCSYSCKRHCRSARDPTPICPAPLTTPL